MVQAHPSEEGSYGSNNDNNHNQNTSPDGYSTINRSCRGEKKNRNTSVTDLLYTDSGGGLLEKFLHCNTPSPSLPPTALT